MTINLNKSKNFKKFLILPILMIFIILFTAKVFVGCGVSDGKEVTQTIVCTNFNNKDDKKKFQDAKILFIEKFSFLKQSAASDELDEKITKKLTPDLKKEWNKFDQLIEMKLILDGPNLQNDWMDKKENSITFQNIKLELTKTNNAKTKEQKIFIVSISNKQIDIEVSNKNIVKISEKYKPEILNITLKE